MKLHRYISEHLDDILSEWTAFAGTNAPASESMSELALRDHAAEILRAVAADIRTQQSEQEQFDKSQGGAEEQSAEESAAAIHGRLRHASNFSLLQLSSEFRALRATVLRLWLPQVEAMSESVVYEMVRFNEAIDQALAESIVTYSERADRTRDLFLAILGHDLRAPLSNMAMAADLLALPNAPPGQVPAASIRIKRGVRLMSSMVSDLLGFTRSQMGAAMPLSLSEIDLTPVCSHAVEDAGSMYPDSEIRVQLEGSLAGQFDAVRLHQLVTNLLVNAAQYGAKRRPIELAVSGDAEAITLTVRNYGEVIPEHVLGTLFQPLVQLDPDANDEIRPRTSMGLGLFVASETAKAHGASIEVASSEIAGTVFTVRFPKARP